MIYENDELYHYGIKGMRWGVRRARHSNAKVDKSFNKWKDNARKKEMAIDYGKKRNEKLMALESDPKNKFKKSEYKQANREYKRALRANTTYRKGAIRGEVGKDISRKYLTEAKRIKKQLDSDPKNSELKSKYNDYMNKHDVERAKARRAPAVGAARSQRIANLKRANTLTIKAAMTTVAIGVGVKVTNNFLQSKGLEGLSDTEMSAYADLGRKLYYMSKYFY